MTAHTKKFQAELYEEMKGRIEEKDESVPYLFNGYYYITRYEVGQDYPIYSRKKGSLQAQEEIMFDCNEMAKGHKYFKVKWHQHQQRQPVCGFRYRCGGQKDLHDAGQNLITGEILADRVENFTGNATW
jgi:oligopeptidase B